MKFELLIGLLFIFVEPIICGEDLQISNDPERHYFWIALGAGPSSTEYQDYRGISAALIPTYQYKNHVINLRFSNVGEVVILEGPSPSQYVHDISLLYGWCRKNDLYYISIAPGIGRIKGVHRGDYIGDGGEDSRHEKFIYQSIGLSLDGQFSIFTPYIGVGVYVFSNINPENSYWSFILSIQLGKLLEISKGN